VVHQDILTCGVCQKPFALADIVKFIQHKVLACNKENYSLGFSGGDHRDANNTDSDDGEGGSGGGGNGSSSLPVPLSVVNTRRPSISAPINSKKAVAAASASSSASISTPGRILCTPPPTSPRMLGPSDILMDEPPSSTPKRRAGSSSPSSKADDLNHNLQDEDLKPRIKQEHLDTGSSPDEAVVKRIRTDVVDAESNTTHSGKLCAVSFLFHKVIVIRYNKANVLGAGVLRRSVQQKPAVFCNKVKESEACKWVTDTISFLTLSIVYVFLIRCFEG